MANIFKKTYDFLAYDMWRRTSSELGGSHRIMYSIMKTIVLVVRGFVNKDLNTLANALTYSLLFAIVPILAMILAIAKGFGMAEVIEQQLRSSFIGETNMVDNIMSFVERYLETAQGGVFIGIGLLILVWAVYSFFRTVEGSFNNIWNVQKSRSIMRQLTTYLAILFLVPILIIVSSGLSIFISTAIENLPIPAWLVEHHDHHHTLRFVQWLMGVLIFTWLYWAVPNTKVRLLSCLIPGILVGSLYLLLESLSVYVIMFLGRTSIVYGAFASIPILLTWLQWTCLLILIGAQMSFAIQNNERYEYEHDLQRMSRRYKDHIMLFILNAIIRRFEADEKPMTAHEIATDYHLPIRLVNQLLTRMTDTGILREIYVEGKEDKTFQPAFDTHKITLGEVMKRIEAQGAEEFLRSCDNERRTFWLNLQKIKKEHCSLDDVLVSEIGKQK